MSITEFGRAIATVIIPTYNDAEFLVHAVEIACGQTLREIEIIVVDDNSKVPVEPTVRAVAGCDARVSVIRRQVTGGVFEAQNTGIEKARGKYVYLGSTNDPIAPNFIEVAVGALERHSAAGMFFCDPGAIYFDSEQRESFALHLADQQIYIDPDQFAERIRHRPFHISSNTAVFCADALHAVGGCRSEFGIYTDWFTCIVTALRTGAVYVPQVLAYSRVHEGAFSDPRDWNTSMRSDYAAKVLRAIATEFPEICPRLRYSRVVSEFGVRVLLALRDDPVFQPLVGAGGLAMASLRDAWGLARRFVPDNGRRRVRKIAMTSRLST